MSAIGVPDSPAAVVEASPLPPQPSMLPPAPRTVPPGRVELKYCVPEEVADRVLRIARTFLPADQYLEASRRQRIRSLYLDTPCLTFLRWQRERLNDRFKLRIRAYGDGPWTRVYAEVKRRAGPIVRKKRASVPWGALPALLAATDLSGVAELARDDRAAVQAFARRALIFAAEPKVLLTCVRESLRGERADEETAVTVDREILCQPARDMNGNDALWVPLSLPSAFQGTPVILELKHGQQPPAWMSTLMTRLRSSRVSFSKYATSMTQLPDWEIR